MDEVKVVFIGGTGRSGTTVFKNALVSSCDVFASFGKEPRFFVDPGGVIDLYAALTRDWSPYQAHAALSQFCELWCSCFSSVPVKTLLRFSFARLGISGPRYGQLYPIQNRRSRKSLARFLWSLGVEQTSSNWYGSSPFRYRPIFYEAPVISEEQFVQSMKLLVRELIKMTARPNGEWFLDDTPYSVLHAETMSKIVPAAKYINMVRDPLDVWASYRRQHWSQPGDAQSRLLEVYRRLINVEGRFNSSATWINIRLEDCIRSGEQEASRLQSFLNEFRISSSSFAEKFQDIGSHSTDSVQFESEEDAEFFHAIRRHYGYI